MCIIYEHKGPPDGVGIWGFSYSYMSLIWLSYKSMTILYMRLTYECHIYDTYMIIIYRGIQGSSCLHIIHIYVIYMSHNMHDTHVRHIYKMNGNHLITSYTHIYVIYMSHNMYDTHMRLIYKINGNIVVYITYGPNI